MTVRELLARMDSYEFSEWMVFSEMEPFGSSLENYRAGIVAAAIYNVNRDPKKGKVIQPEDFFPHEKEPPTPEELYARFRAWAGFNQKE